MAEPQANPQGPEPHPAPTPPPSQPPPESIEELVLNSFPEPQSPPDKNRPDEVVELGRIPSPDEMVELGKERADEVVQLDRDGFLAPEEQADDSPTIISKSQRRAEKEEAFATNLRGRQLAHFILLDPIGVGGMAAVIRAKDTQLERIVALKILPPEMATEAENIRRFHHEARAAAKLDHENIARVFYCGDDQGLHFIAFEFVEGENLRTLLERRGRLPLPEALNYMLQVTTGLAHAAARSVVHRDIKPSNIIISTNGRAKLVDMGLARSLEPHADKDLTQSGVTLGTFDYISPEQAMEPREADTRSDIYSLGCTFYHMLTGQPPVPEGTAAKKLHCHEHVPPVDPRQLNPEIPDEVAAILAKMMAKNPRDRYQRPEQLVQHLIHVASKLGVAGDLPEGALFMDAPLPGPPRVRPVLIGFIAAAALVAVVALLSAMNGSTEPKDPPPPLLPRVIVQDGKDKSPEKIDTPKIDTSPKGVALNPPKDREIVKTGKELSDALQKPVDHVCVAVGADIDLVRPKTAEDNPGLIFEGKELTIEAEDPGRRPTLSLSLDPQPPGERPWAVLTMKAGKVTLRGLRFEIDAKGAPVVMAALALMGGDQCELENCEFVQKGVPEAADARHVSHILVSSATKRPGLIMKECLFRRGHEVVAISGAGIVRVSNCAFAPHSTLFHVRGPRDAQETVVKLENCSALLEKDSSAFRVGEAACELQVGNSIFSSPGVMFPDTDGGVLIRQAGSKLPRLIYRVPERQRNCYHHLRALLLVEEPANSPQAVATLEDFNSRFGIEDTQSTEPEVNPWDAKNPLTVLDVHPNEAFQPNPKLPFLRPVGNSANEIIGVQQCVWGKSFPNGLPPVDDKPIEPVVYKTKIVDPTFRQTNKGVYPTLNQAVGEAQPQDEILIRHNGPLEIEPIRRETPVQNVTIKPYKDCRPVLTIKSNDPSAAMFRLGDGHLQFEDLQFRLEAHKPFKSQSVVTIMGDGQCTFTRCVITLQEADPAWAAVVVFDDPANLMNVPGGGLTPKVFLRNCFIRGDGDLVKVLASRRFDLQMDNCLVALSGSLLVVDGNPKEPPLSPATKLSLNRVTACLHEHLISLRSDENKKGLVPTRVQQVLDCVFVSAGKPLIHVEGMDTPEQVMRFFSWNGGKHNVYSGYNQMLDHQPRGDIMVPAWTKETWGSRTGESDLFLMKVSFSEPPAANTLPECLPTHFQVKPDAELKEYFKDGDCGANLAQIPAPYPVNVAVPVGPPTDGD